MNEQPKLIVLCGLPASGKSTYAARLGVTVASADAIRTANANPSHEFAKMHATLRAALRAGKHVVADACSLRPNERLALQRIGRDCYARCELVVFMVPWHVCLRRDAARAQSAKIDWVKWRGLLDDAWRAAPREHWDRVSYEPPGSKRAVESW